MARPTKRQVQQTYDMLLASGTVLDEVFVEAEQQPSQRTVSPERLVELLGARAAVTLVKENGRCCLPSHQKLLNHLRMECIVRDYERGVTTLETLKAKYKCSTALAWRGMAEAKRRMRARTAERLAQAGPAEAFLHRIKLGD